MRDLLKLALCAALLALGIGSAAAVETGSAAWTDFPLPMFEGPGKQYQLVGEVPGQIPVRVDRCSGFWCQIRVGYAQGWVDRYKLSFGRAPYPNLIGPYYLPPPRLQGGRPRPRLPLLRPQLHRRVALRRGRLQRPRPAAAPPRQPLFLGPHRRRRLRHPLPRPRLQILLRPHQLQPAGAQRLPRRQRQLGPCPLKQSRRW